MSITPAKRIYLSPPDVGQAERELLLEAFDSNWIAPLGPQVDAFELELSRLVGPPHAVALSSGTAALHLGLHVLEVGAGDEVITSTLTFAATANAIAYLGASPVFIDVSESTWTMDTEALREELEHCARRGRLPKAVVPVDLYGQCCDYDPLLAACEQYGVPVLEDAAEALGASYRGRQAGTFGDAAVFSFNGNKIVTTSGGGMLVSRRREIVERVRFLATQARDPAPHYEHSSLGYNYRLSNLLAAVGRGQLRSLPEKIASRRRIRAEYRAALADLPGVHFMPEAEYGEGNAWLTCVTIDPSAAGVTREEIRAALEEANIEARPVWKPMHLQPLYAEARRRGGTVSASLFERGLCLPSGSSLTAADHERVVETIRRAFAGARGRGRHQRPGMARATD